MAKEVGGDGFSGYSRGVLPVRPQLAVKRSQNPQPGRPRYAVDAVAVASAFSRQPHSAQ